ncbi:MULTISPECIES: ArsR/SmtB family transcription factor [Bacillota]|jgi:DNA-binding transcriptional ArsR family regulator|uniref:Helix-turn-helix transcriptional regulator n=2 Tax=Amedibacillus TaxID=2749846 RepID=A0A7G9GJF2_9FIRM|nr:MULTISPECIES: metalloregulator ArsR/SmtB family transcription factor [Bacillota]QNM10934.1 helix-turn-helix transcriptional regulator [[Eubacterium] hominis]MCH4285370.1 metalloregulator ArsR/SmtB family transcription factor [Amedibacillus hominis]RGB58426.1 transcriptional regulator [Absiella sp. AM22-9]RGB63314.1 transcriptional regulator [Absiella sp. AM10-20]RGB67144.1 transcriptional regulator [Absiella sp. AM09-45]
MDKKIPVCSEPHVHEDVVNRVKDEMLTQEEFNDLSVLFKMYADPTRLKILSLLFKEEMCVCDISTLLDMTQSAVSHQLSVLRQNRIIKYRRSGKNIYYSLDDEHIQLIFDAGLAHIME